VAAFVLMQLLGAASGIGAVALLYPHAVPVEEPR
jgi:hypothetical protein